MAKNESTEIMLKLKHGTIVNAYKHWFNTPSDKKHGMTHNEVQFVNNWFDKMRAAGKVHNVEMYETL